MSEFASKRLLETHVKSGCWVPNYQEQQMQQESQWLNFFQEKELEKRFPCTNTSCSKAFKNEHTRYTHVKYHCEKPQRYQCGHCGKKSHIKHNLMLHSYKKHKLSSADIRELYSYKAVKSNYF
ncbi:hypothetical protein G9C98_007950 [Cotesia typhae]|uniref:C2H2-type domain-containing protein n=1 Tax=Cotesia typhae TaxID=2053667 RepID=A0A8J5R1J2_9HYME|nr:hypothetical protein G9C98_007950 [Cotesia typhae]